MRVVRDYDEYVLRNLSRGCSRQSMNVSLLKEQQIKLRATIGKLRTRLKSKQGRIKEYIKKWTRRIEGDASSSEESDSAHSSDAAASGYA